MAQKITGSSILNLPIDPAPDQPAAARRCRHCGITTPSMTKPHNKGLFWVSDDECSCCCPPEKKSSSRRGKVVEPSEE